jgi:hypothetical protein
LVTQVYEEPRGVTWSLTSNHPSVPVQATKNQTGIGSDNQNQNQISLRTRILILFMSETRTVTVLLYFLELESDVLHKSKETCTLLKPLLGSSFDFVKNCVLGFLTIRNQRTFSSGFLKFFRITEPLVLVLVHERTGNKPNRLVSSLIFKEPQ